MSWRRAAAPARRSGSCSSSSSARFSGTRSLTRSAARGRARSRPLAGVGRHHVERDRDQPEGAARRAAAGLHRRARRRRSRPAAHRARPGRLCRPRATAGPHLLPPTGRLTMATSLPAPDTAPRPHLLRPDSTNCPGCGMSLGLQWLDEALGAATPTLVVPACCAIVTPGAFPASAYSVPAVATTFASAAAVATGITRVRQLNGEADPTICWAGDGGTYDIGLATLSAAAERNEDVLYICYDNEIYGNTGGQRSGATPRGAKTTTTPRGKAEAKKDIMAIMAAHRVPYAATLSLAHRDDFLRKIRLALACRASASCSCCRPARRAGSRSPPRASSSSASQWPAASSRCTRCSTASVTASTPALTRPRSTTTCAGRDASVLWRRAWTNCAPRWNASGHASMSWRGRSPQLSRRTEGDAVESMLALVKNHRGPGLALESVPVPSAGAGEVVIRVLKTAICGTDVHIYEWDEWAQRTLSVPLVVGHEFVGRIVELGAVSYTHLR